MLVLLPVLWCLRHHVAPAVACGKVICTWGTKLPSLLASAELHLGAWTLGTPTPLQQSQWAALGAASTGRMSTHRPQPPRS